MEEEEKVSGLNAYMDEVLDEALAQIPQHRRQIDFDMAMRYPMVTPLPVEAKPVIGLACDARRQGAISRAEAIEWAYDCHVRKTGYRRVGEVYPIKRYAKTTNGEMEVRDYYEALCVEKDETE